MTFIRDTVLSHPFINDILSLSTFELCIGAAAIYAVIKFLQVIYRISPLHPLAKVPEPRLAAATWWYRTYHEVPGRLVNVLERLHAKYGPVVRIAPNEVHFSAPSAYLHIFSNASKVVKDPFHYHCYNEDLASFGFCDPALSKERREILSPFFSRRNILTMHYVVEDKLCLLTHHLRSIAMSAHEGNPSGNVVDMFHATKSFTMDVIMEFCFAKTLEALRSPKFHHPLVLGVEKSIPMFWTFKHFPLIKHIVNNIPDKVAKILMPDGSKGVQMLQSTLGEQVDEFLHDPEGMAEGVRHEVIYHRLLGVGKFAEKREDGELVPRSKIGKRSLIDEAQALLFGGTDTVGNTLSVGAFHILNTPGVVDRLMEELRTVWPGNPWIGMPEVEDEYIDGCARLPVGWETLEKLPYLGAVIRESLRISHGTVSPLQRLAPPQGITVDGWTFPGGTGVSSTGSFVHLNPEIFPDPHSFRPERWLGPGAAGLETYLVPFSKGPRACLGLNLAWCELYLSFATLYRRFEFELVDTTFEDLRYRDFMIPSFNGRIKVRVKARID